MQSKKAESVDLTDKNTEKQLESEGREAPVKDTMEPQLSKERGPKKEINQTMEGQLADGRGKARSAAVNENQTGIVEKRLNEAKQTVYPHRNEQAYKRTGNKRPVNALNEEMGDAGDKAKDDRYQEKWRTPAASKKTDGDVVQAFNLKKKKFASYLSYKDGQGDFTVVKGIDAKLASIMSKAQNESREYTDQEKNEIETLKTQKAAALGHNGKA